MIYAALVIGCLLLYKGGDWLLDAMLLIGQRFDLPKAVVGLVLVSLGTSAPEFFISVQSAIQNHGGLAVGNVVGSNIINVAVVLGIALLVSGLAVERRLQVQIVAITLLTAVAAWFIQDQQVTRLEGLGLVALMCGTMALAFRSSDTEQEIRAAEESAPMIDDDPKKLYLKLLGGLIALVVGAEAMIWGGLGLAHLLGLPETVIALTVTALGTSLPEIAASVVAMLRRESNLALGNVIGSNILNIGLVMGVSAVIMPLRGVEFDPISAAYFIGLVLVILAFAMTTKYLPRMLGYLLIVLYASYVTLLLV